MRLTVLGLTVSSLLVAPSRTGLLQAGICLRVKSSRFVKLVAGAIFVVTSEGVNQTGLMKAQGYLRLKE